MSGFFAGDDLSRLWVAVLGTGTFGFGRRTAAGVKMQTLSAGDVVDATDDPQLLAAARDAIRKGSQTVILSPMRPTLVRREARAPLGRAVLDGGWYLLDATVATPEQIEAGEVPSDFPCSCGNRYPSRGALTRHQEMSCPDRIPA